MPERAYLSIGEVLALLKEEFADITISKIRFLESQGLIDPERTPSGYRKFYDSDVERLRWILRQQREHFLPLKVIKGRLSATGEEEELDQEAGVEDGVHAAAGPAEDEPEELVAAVVPATTASSGPPEGQPDAEPAPMGRRRLVAGGMRGPGLNRPGPGTEHAAGPPPGGRGEPAISSAFAPLAGPPPADTGPSGAHLTIEEMASACGLTVSGIQELERYGLLAGKAVAGTVYYDEEALITARLAAGFLRFGVEARHLRMYKTAAEREAGLFEQVVMPLLKQRNPQARQQAADTLNELAGLGQSLRAAMLRHALRESTGG